MEFTLDPEDFYLASDYIGAWPPVGPFTNMV